MIFIGKWPLIITLSDMEITVPANGKALVKTGISMAIPMGNYGRIAPRSGLAWKNFINVGAGVIDSDYRGELGVLLFNHANTDFVGRLLSFDFLSEIRR
jgi:dUTP pyrophosphatase